MTISVCMATRNGADFVKEQIDSILIQLKKDDELVISDDESSDGTLKIIQAIDDKRIRLLPAKIFNDPAKNFEYALTYCKNDIIFLSDQDDIWHINKVEVMTEVLRHYDLAVCDCRIVDEDKKIIEPSFFSRNGSRKGLLKNFYRSSFVGCCMAFRKKISDKAVPFPTGIVLHDQWIGLIAQKYYRVVFIPQTLVDHRRHSQNYSTTGGRSKNSLGKKVISRLKLAKMLLQR